MIIAILLSGGNGTRLGSQIPKQYIKLGSKTVIGYCLETLDQCKKIDKYLIVASEEWQDFISQSMTEHGLEEKFLGFAKPGLNRQLSIYNGLKRVDELVKCADSPLGLGSDELMDGPSDFYVMVHDAARPLLKADEIEKYTQALEGHDGLMPALPMKDTVYVSRDGHLIDGLLDRSTIYAGQAPEFFAFKKYLRACEDLMTYDESGQLSQDSEIMRINGSSEVAVKAGMDIAIVPGSESNFKITTMADLERFRQIVQGARD